MTGAARVLVVDDEPQIVRGLSASLRAAVRSASPAVSALDGEGDKIAALDAGADDYVTKPYAVGELLARLRATLRRATAPTGGDPVVHFGDVAVDLAARLVRRGGEAIHLTPREYDLLAELARHPGRVLTHATLLKAIWGPTFVAETHYLRVHMASLRQKIEPEPARPRHLITETGVGYRLRIDADRGSGELTPS